MNLPGTSLIPALEPFGIFLSWSVETLCTMILLGYMVVLITLERLFPYRKGLSFFRKGFWIDLIWYTFIQSFFLKILIFDYVIAPAKTGLGLAESGYISHWPVWAIILFFLVTHDFYIYWFHRLQHANKWLWRTHEAHHSVEQVDWLAGSRSHMLEIVINQTIEFAPIFFLLDLETAAVVVPIKALLDAMWGQFIHANLRVNLGKLGYIINGPELHLWHHADHAEVYHANFGTKFSIWDYLFGTAYRPGIPPRRYGVWYRFPRGWFAQHVFSVFRFHVGRAESPEQPLGKLWLLRVQLLNLTYRWMPISWQHFFFPKGPLQVTEEFGPKPELADRT